MMGIDVIHIVAVDGTSLDKAALKGAIERAHQQVRSVIEGIKY